MAASDYVQLASLKSTLSIQSGDTTYDNDLQLAITAASRAIDEIGGPGRRFYADTSDVARQFWPENTGYCIIDDLSSFTSLTANGATWTKDTDFYLEPINAAPDGRPWTAIRAFAKPFIFTKAEVQPGGWTGYDGRITVTGKWGWASTPEPVQEAAIILATRLFNRARQAPFGIVSIDAQAAVRLGSTDPDVMSLVEPYARSVLIA